MRYDSSTMAYYLAKRIPGNFVARMPNDATDWGDYGTTTILVRRRKKRPDEIPLMEGEDNGVFLGYYEKEYFIGVFGARTKHLLYCEVYDHIATMQKEWRLA